MFEFIKFLQKRPTDKQIRIGRILFGSIFMGILTYNFFFQGADSNTIKDAIFFGLIPTNTPELKMGVEIGIILLGSFALIMGITGACIMAKKYLRITLMVLSVLMFFASSFIVPSAGLDIEVLVFVFGFIPLFAGITGKSITSKCLKYGEVIKKIRV